MEWVLRKINDELKEFTSSVEKNSEEFLSHTKKSIGDMTESAKKSMDVTLSKARKSLDDLSETATPSPAPITTTLPDLWIGKLDIGELGRNKINNYSVVMVKRWYKVTF